LPDHGHWPALPWESASGMLGWATLGGCNTNNWDCLCPHCGAVQAKVCNGSGHIRREWRVAGLELVRKGKATLRSCRQQNEGVCVGRGKHSGIGFQSMIQGIGPRGELPT